MTASRVTVEVRGARRCRPPVTALPFYRAAPGAQPRWPTTCPTPTRTWPPCWASWAWRRSTSCSTACRRPCGWPAAWTWPTASPEPDVLAHMEELGRAPTGPGGDRLVCFAGGGAYDHEVPPVVAGPGRPLGVRHLLHALPARGGPGRPAGGLRVPDHGGPAGRAAGRQRLPLRRGQRPGRGGEPGRRRPPGGPTVWLSAGVHPHWRAVLATFAAGTGHHLVDVPLDRGRDPLARAPAGRAERPGVVVVGYPNYLGCLEDLAPARAAVRRPRARCWWWRPTRCRPACCERPASGGPTWWWGRARPSAPPSASAARTSGCSPARSAQVRRLPGRLVGETVDRGRAGGPT